MKPLILSACAFTLFSASALPAFAQTCPQPNKPAGVKEMPQISFPTIKHSPAHGTVVLRVDISSKGELVGHDFLETTGNSNLDMEALQAAHRVQYTPELINCKPTAGSYLFVVVFPQS